ncbi:MAG: ATPase [Chloroflexota bacterium]|nr:ATPase [Chloroflexota bacterium]MDE2840392.1 ATPase [Chloroflexota bacterium]MDE2930598.1 ATPase [Chloroflexota bacterium]
MDIFALIERLEALVNTGQRVPFVNKIMLDEQECLDVIAQMRMSVPDEVRQARRMLQERSRIPEQARLEAERIVAIAHEQAEEVLSEHGLVRAAEDNARQIVEDAEEQASEIHRESDAYAVRSLTDLRTRLEQLHERVQIFLEAMADTEPEGVPSTRARGDRTSQDLVE